MKRNVFVIAIVGMLLLSSFLALPVFSSGTDDEETSTKFKSETTVWDNGMDYVGVIAAQWDESYPFDAYPADDFQFDEDTVVNNVHWIGGYFNDDYNQGNFDWNITFYYDRGDGKAPGSVYAGPYTYTQDQYTQTLLEDMGDSIYYELSVNLSSSLTFDEGVKYWISIWGVGALPPQSGWGYNETTVTMHQAVFKSVYFEYPDWTNVSDSGLLGYPADMCFQLIFAEQSATIITIENELPANNSVDISISQPNVSVYISAVYEHSNGNVSAMTYLPFNWTIEGKYIENAGANDDGAGTKTADVITSLPYSTEIIWYVNVTVNEFQENKIFRFTTEGPPNQPPVANFTYLIEGLKVTFNGSISSDPDGYIENYTWDFGDGNVSYMANPEHLFGANGSYDVNLTVKDDEGANNSYNETIDVTNARPVVGFTAEPDSKTVTFTSTSYDVDGDIANYTWYFGDGNTSYDENPVHTYAAENHQYAVTLKVTDNLGLTNSTTKTVKTQDTTDPTVEIVTPERAVYINGEKKFGRLLGMAIIIGDITIEVNASDEGSGIAKVEFYGGLLGTKPLGNDTEAPYTFEWTRDRIRFLHIQTLKVVAYDNEGNVKGSRGMIVRKLL